MKPVLIQHLIHDRKKKSQPMDPVLEEVVKQHNRAADFVVWFVIGMVVLGLLLS